MTFSRVCLQPKVVHCSLCDHGTRTEVISRGHFWKHLIKIHLLMPEKQAAVKCCLFEQHLILFSFYLIFYCSLTFSLSADYCEIRAIVIFIKDKCFIRRKNGCLIDLSIARKIVFFQNFVSRILSYVAFSFPSTLVLIKIIFHTDCFLFFPPAFFILHCNYWWKGLIVRCGTQIERRILLMPVNMNPSRQTLHWDSDEKVKLTMSSSRAQMLNLLLDGILQ